MDGSADGSNPDNFKNFVISHTLYKTITIMKFLNGGYYLCFGR